MRSLKTEITKVIEACRGEIAEFTSALVAIPTENPPGRAYRECAAAIAEKLRQIGLESVVQEILPTGPHAGASPGYCLTSFFGRGPRTLYFHGHYDVVPASSEAQFAPRAEHGKLFGRGSADMKSGLVAMIYAVKVLKDLEIELEGRVGLVFVADEETGGARGSRFLADNGILGAGGIGMLTPEPTGGAVWNASRGAISLRVTVRGKPAHVGLECRGVNAFERMLDVADALRAWKKEVGARKTSIQVTPDAARSSILMMGGQCEGGTNFNLVPAECSFTVDRRINPEEDLETEERSLFDIFDRLRRDGIEIEVEILQEGRSSGVALENPLARALMQSVEAIAGKPPAVEMCPGLLETRFYAEKGVPALAYGPGLLSVSHGPNEFVALKDVYSCAAIYALTAVTVLGNKEQV